MISSYFFRRWRKNPFLHPFFFKNYFLLFFEFVYLDGTTLGQSFTRYLHVFLLFWKIGSEASSFNFTLTSEQSLKINRFISSHIFSDVFKILPNNFSEFCFLKFMWINTLGVRICARCVWKTLGAAFGKKKLQNLMGPGSEKNLQADKKHDVSWKKFPYFITFLMAKNEVLVGGHENFVEKL